MKHAYLIPILTILISLLPTGCIEDSISTSSADQPTFSTDTLMMGQVFTLDASPTKRFTVYNRHDKVISISSISLRDDDDNLFRLNVDGVSARSFSNVEIRPNDSIYVFVEATLPENASAGIVAVNRHLDFVTNGVSQTVVLNIEGQNVVRCNNLTISADTYWTADSPYQIFDTLRIAQGATLTLLPGTTIHFHDKAAMKIEGRLVSNGTADNNVNLIGDRTGNVAASIPYELMSGQWGGLYFGANSTGNLLQFTSIRNSVDGLVFTPASADNVTARIVNCQIRNTQGYIIDAYHANLQLIGCELADASSGILHLVGGCHTINHCTIANYYLFTALGGPAIQFEHINSDNDDASGLPYISAEITNTIIYGNGTELSHGDLTGTNVYLRRCLLRSEGSDDDNFINCIWGEDPLYYTVRNEYLFDYRLKDESPAISASDPSLDDASYTCDRYGLTLHNPADLGAYVYTPAQ
jgi:hypothetical protein